ncbi:UNVERIFIED_CONTAM: hypothetical protein GTU68_053488 [Idotea baltica]|nr:hypothetical protein [Idotea baltica]
MLNGKIHSLLLRNYH